VVVVARLIVQVLVKAAQAVAEMLMVLLKEVQELGPQEVVVVVDGTMAVVVAVAVVPALLLSVIKTYIKRNNNFFLII
jgi:hypothetical protein